MQLGASGGLAVSDAPASARITNGGLRAACYDQRVSRHWKLIALASLLIAPACASWWNGPAQRAEIQQQRGEVLKEYHDGKLVVFVWRQGPNHYNKWVCNTGYYHNCFDGYSVDQIARSCSVAHEGPEQVVDCAGLKADNDLAPYVTW